MTERSSSEDVSDESESEEVERDRKDSASISNGITGATEGYGESRVERERGDGVETECDEATRGGTEGSSAKCT